MTFTVNGKTYKLQYSIEAFTSKFVDEDGNSVLHIMPLIKMADSEEDAYAALDIPNAVCHAMYAGLMRNHGMGKRGDKSITCLEDAAELCMELIDENPDDEKFGSWSGLIKLCTDQMTEDRFFEKFAPKAMGAKKAKKN